MCLGPILHKSAEAQRVEVPGKSQQADEKQKNKQSPITLTPGSLSLCMGGTARVKLQGLRSDQRAGVTSLLASTKPRFFSAGNVPLLHSLHYVHYLFVKYLKIFVRKADNSLYFRLLS